MSGLSVRRILPHPGEVDLDELLRGVAGSPVVEPFSPERVDFVADVARTLSKLGRAMPATQALAFWMRRSELTRLKSSFEDAVRPGTLLMPRGTVFHVPPSNVDTLFVYSWVLSLLAGNRNIIRISSRASDQSNAILETIGSHLADRPDIAATTAMVTYGHEDSITARISADADVRVIWGGDQTIRSVRKAPLPVHATELTFADRFSMAAIATGAYAALDDAGRDALAERFHNDTYWFDQMGCSSARLLIWVGDEPDGLDRDFHQRVTAQSRAKGYRVDTAATVAKMAQSYRGMIDFDVEAYLLPDNTLTVLKVSDFPHVRGEFCGGGLLYQIHAEALDDIVPHIERSDQTLAVFGLDAGEVERFLRLLCGRGIDRVVPIGQALAFDRVWDGYDLLAQLTRSVTFNAAPAR